MWSPATAIPVSADDFGAPLRENNVAADGERGAIPVVGTIGAIGTTHAEPLKSLKPQESILMSDH